MNIFRNLDSNTSNGSDKVKDLLSYSPLSDSSIINTGGGSDEEIIQLASNRPKRRAGRMKFRETRHPIYRGVRQRNGDKWVSEVREPNKKSRIWLGTFPTPEMAARAHDVASIALRGRSACLNFADSIWKVPLPESLDAKDIRKAAGEAARAFHQSEELMEVRREELNSPAVPEKVFYMDDDEAEFGMPRILADMADGLLLSPPHPRDFSWDDVETNAEVALWSYSI